MARPSTPPARPPAPNRPRPAQRSHTPQRVRVRLAWWQSPWAWGGGATLVVVAAVVAVILIATSASPAATPSGNQPVPASVLAAVTQVSSEMSSGVGAGGVRNPLIPIAGSPAPLTSNGRPELVYIGAEYCPFCAAERWGVVVALSRFGSFTDLETTTSDSNPNDYPNTHTFSFVHATYASQYLAFAAVETEDRNGAPLQTPTAAEQSLLDRYDTAPYTSQAGGIPFQDLGNRYVLSGSGIDPQLLQGMSWQQIAATLSDPASAVGQAIVGDANWLTAGICALTGNQPQAVCAAAPIPALQSSLGAA
jgi:hypothetical protein